jgi:RimJ/RimL family protein N-acetyltransferase
MDARMNNAPVLRRAVPADAAILAQLRFAFRSTLGSAIENERDFLTRTERWLDERLRTSAWLAWVADAPGTGIVGQCYLQAIEKIPNPVGEAEWIGYVTNVFVKAEWRGRGIASSLIDLALDHCNTHGAYSVILWPTDESRSLYARNGFGTSEQLLELPCSTTIPSSQKT